MDEQNSNKQRHNLLRSVLNPFEVFSHHPIETAPQKELRRFKFTTSRSFEALIFLTIFFLFFGLLAYKMTLPHMLNTFMQTAYHLLLETVFYLMAHEAPLQPSWSGSPRRRDDLPQRQPRHHLAGQR